MADLDGVTISSDHPTVRVGLYRVASVGADLRSSVELVGAWSFPDVPRPGETVDVLGRDGVWRRWRVDAVRWDTAEERRSADVSLTVTLVSQWENEDQ